MRRSARYEHPDDEWLFLAAQDRAGAAGEAHNAPLVTIPDRMEYPVATPMIPPNTTRLCSAVCCPITTTRRKRDVAPTAYRTRLRR